MTVVQMLARELKQAQQRVSALQAAMKALGGNHGALVAPSKPRRVMSQAQRQAVGKRMKAYWAKRKKAQ